jgi:hypothetical protein
LLGILTVTLKEQKSGNFDSFILGFRWNGKFRQSQFSQTWRWSILPPGPGGFRSSRKYPGGIQAELVVVTGPTGLAGGSSFQIIMITPITTVATSTDIFTYNSFVTALLTNGLGANSNTQNGLAITFKA